MSRLPSSQCGIGEKEEVLEIEMMAVRKRYPVIPVGAVDAESGRREESGVALSRSVEVNIDLHLVRKVLVEYLGIDDHDARPLDVFDDVRKDFLARTADAEVPFRDVVDQHGGVPSILDFRRRFGFPVVEHIAHFIQLVVIVPVYIPHVEFGPEVIVSKVDRVAFLNSRSRLRWKIPPGKSPRGSRFCHRPS